MSGSGVTRWEQTRVIAEMSAEMLANMEIAANVVKLAARKNLLRVNVPEFGRKYRMVLALYRLTSRVSVEGNTLSVAIGIPKKFVGNTEKAQSYGYYVDVGTRKYPATGWLRRAMAENIPAIKVLLKSE